MKNYLNLISRLDKVSGWLKLTLYICFLPISPVCLQTYYAFGSLQYLKIEVDEGLFCTVESLGFATEYDNGASFCPDGRLLTMSGQFLFEFDVVSGNTTQLAVWPGGGSPVFNGMVCYSDSIIYTLEYPSGHLFIWNINSGITTDLGSTGFLSWEGFSLVEGELYGSNSAGIYQIDKTNPGNSFLFLPAENPTRLGNPVPSMICNTFICATESEVQDNTDKLTAVNWIDGAMTDLCELGINLFEITTIQEHLPPENCETSLDLDGNDSSGATGSDFNSSVVTCFMSQASIADQDVRMVYDAIVSEMTIRLIGFVPDGSNEIIDITGSIPGIEVSGQGSDILTLSNAGGAKSTDFIDALQLVRYNNTALNPTGGQRTVEVQFTTVSGSMSNVAIAFIQVDELPSLDVDLGPDQIICEGQTATFDAGSFLGGMYAWSSGETDQMITTSLDGEYAVTVSNGIRCPDADTALVITIPVITVALTGDTEICDNQSATLTLNTNATFPLTVEIQANPGFPLVFDDVIGTYSFTDLPLSSTTYTITSVTPSSDACIEVHDEDHTVDVFPSYNHIFDVSMCDGDSIWLGFYWETEAGSFQYGFNSLHGCDSNVTSNISILPAVMIQAQATTCDLTATGVFITTIDNPNGCDTIVETTVSLLSADTTYQLATTCVFAQAGVSQNALTGTDGCDSLIITTTTYIPPADTTYLYAETCDPAQVDVINHVSTGIDGCDSIVITTITLMSPDTTYLVGTSCIPAQIGVFETMLTDAQGCDSLVISTITMGVGDTTHIAGTSCDLAQTGVWQYVLTGIDGCDSLVISTVTFALADTTYLFDTTCDPSQAGVSQNALTGTDGCDSLLITTTTLNISHQIDLTSSSCNPSDIGVFVQQLTNQFGCDSIITETISLLPSDQTFLNETTCLSSDAGMFITTHLNQYGCDSIVTLTVSLVAADTTQIIFNTCDPTQTGSIETLYTGQDGCDSLVIETTTLFPLPELTVLSAIDYNGFDISCTGGMDGSAIANVNGVSPYTYLWSTDDTDQMITGLTASDYDVAITDGNGCMTSGSVTLTEPDLFMIGFEVSEPDCFDQQLGSIAVLPSGGVAPYTYSIDGTTYQASTVFTGLAEGIYQITSLDANDCITSEIISIDVPLMVNVDLGENQSIDIGDTTLLEAIINLPFDSLSAVMWTGIDSLGCINCLTQIVAPIITTAYSVSVTTADGCADRDSLTIFVNTDHKIYIPNIFSPNGDGINDVLKISADESVQEIASFSIVDRWGNLVFGAEHKQVDDPTLFWDGKMKGEEMNPGVFTYRAVVVFINGESTVVYGDITLIK
jgi:gliding motility-associated-like protein